MQNFHLKILILYIILILYYKTRNVLNFFVKSLFYFSQIETELGTLDLLLIRRLF